MSVLRKVALVTGAAQGLGKGFSEALLKRGGQVCVADVKVQTGEATVSDFNKRFGEDSAFFVKCDVTKDSDIKEMFDSVKKRYGRLDLVVNNAGIANEDHWETMVDINMKGVIRGTHYGVESLSLDKGGNGGLIVNIASMAGIIPVFGASVYVATKFGVVGFTRSMANDPFLKKAGLKFACLCPSFAETDIINIEEGSVQYKDITKQFLKEYGIMPVSQVVDAFVQLLDMPENNGVVMAVEKSKGVQIKWDLSVRKGSNKSGRPETT